MDQMKVTIAAEQDRTRLLATLGQDEVMRAVLGPATAAHPKAVATFLEGLSLWHQQQVFVVLCVDERSAGYELGLVDALGYGTRSLHYEVGIVVDHHRGRGRRMGGPGDFRTLRRLATEVGR